MTEQLRAKVLLPTLGDHYGNVLDRGELRLAFDPEQGAFSLVYYEHRFPVDPREYPLILAPGLGRHRVPARPRAPAAPGAHQPGHRLRASPAAIRDRPRPPRRAPAGQGPVQAAPGPALPGVRRRRLVRRRVPARVQRRRRLPGQPGAPAPAARGPGIPPGVLAGGRGRDQLPSLLRHQRPRLPAHGASTRCSKRPTGWCWTWCAGA